MYHDGLVPSPSLHLVHLFNDISDGSKVGLGPRHSESTHIKSQGGMTTCP